MNFTNEAYVNLKVAIRMLLIFALFFSIPCYQQIFSIKSLKEAQDVLQNANKKTVIFFDVDDTLLVSENSAFWSKNATYTQVFYALVSKKLSAMDKSAPYYRAIWRAKERLVVLEPCSVDIIKSLQKRDVTVFACTALLPTSQDYAINNYLPSWRFDTLKKVDIDFSSKIPDIELTGLKELHGTYEYHPILYKGILCTCNRLSKGVVIGELFDLLSLTPEKVIFFDDNLKHVEDVVLQMSKRGILCIGYHYNGKENLTSNFDPEIIEFQMCYLVAHEEWLSENEAKQKMLSQQLSSL